MGNPLSLFTSLLLNKLRSQWGGIRSKLINKMWMKRGNDTISVDEQQVCSPCLRFRDENDRAIYNNERTNQIERFETEHKEILHLENYKLL